MKHLIPLLLLSTQLHADPIDPALPPDDDDIVNLYRTNARQDEKIGKLETDMNAIKYQMQTCGGITKEQLDTILLKANQISQPQSRPFDPAPTQPTFPQFPSNSWTDGSGRRHEGVDHEPGGHH